MNCEEKVCISIPWEYIYDVINNIEEYPVFLSFVSSIRVKSESTLDNHCSKRDASVFIRDKSISLKYDCCIISNRQERTITVSSDEAFFKKFIFIWSISSITPNETCVCLKYSLDLRNPIQKALLDKTVSLFLRKIQESFIKRAQHNYKALN